MKEPRIALGDVEDPCDGISGAKRVANEVNPFGVRRAELRVDRFLVDGLVATMLSAATETARAGLERAQAFLNRFLESASDRHRFADGLHRGRQRRVGVGEFFKGEARD